MIVSDRTFKSCKVGINKKFQDRRSIYMTNNGETFGNWLYTGYLYSCVPVDGQLATHVSIILQGPRRIGCVRVIILWRVNYLQLLIIRLINQSHRIPGHHHPFNPSPILLVNAMSDDGEDLKWRKFTWSTAGFDARFSLINYFCWIQADISLDSQIKIKSSFNDVKLMVDETLLAELCRLLQVCQLSLFCNWINGLGAFKRVVKTLRLASNSGERIIRFAQVNGYSPSFRHSLILRSTDGIHNERIVWNPFLQSW